MAKLNWTVDKAHSEVGFSVKHMMISRAKGTFDNFDARIKADVEDLTDAEIEVTIDVASINTRNSDRDNHLRSEDFFDAESHPNITFIATDIKKSGGNNYKVNGDLTLKGTTKPATLDVTFEGESKDPMSGDLVAGFSGSTSINRKEFGLTWNASLETGGVLVGEDVKIQFELELHKAE
ncbi:YceI family protein [Oceanobacillus sp. J11TS1]|uniref:YceI family protein n=1 Tax=Oceanobacillus sp. J11TS1 TaxID=2807191 RepID=UPI001B0D2B2B|nr:YceI family protein [Oceanobacillus sp. J11TS1]GIO21701.1 polyisoprenoid-binding protein [Oceanobacillus sp. J11TS1]